MTDKTQQANRIYRDRVLKCITEKPGMVVYRADIVQDTQLPEEKVMGCISQLMRDDDNPLSKDIEIVVPGRAWRYVPNTRVQRAVRAVINGASVSGVSGASGDKLDPRIAKAIEDGRPLPLTHRIREYFAANANRVVYMDDLHKAMNTDETPVTEDQVRVGIYNARINNSAFREQLSTVTAGKAWVFSNNGTEPVVNAQDAAATTPSSSTTTTTTPARATQPAAVPVRNVNVNVNVNDDDQVLLLEYLGKDSSGASLYRDENKNLYRVERL